jgi:hypothetical protein
MTPQGYETPSAFRRALTDRLRNLAASGPWTLPQLQRQIAYDRLLERLYLVDDGWIVKGALRFSRGSSACAPRSTWTSTGKERGTLSSKSSARRQPKTLGTGSARSRPAAACLRRRRRRAAPHQYSTGTACTRSWTTWPTRSRNVRGAWRDAAALDAYRDLVDLVSIVTGASVEAMSQIRALRSEANRRNVTLSERFDVPDRALWEGGYAREAARSLLRVGRTLDDALEIVRPFLNPLLD